MWISWSFLLHPLTVLAGRIIVLGGQVRSTGGRGSQGGDTKPDSLIDGQATGAKTAALLQVLWLRGMLVDLVGLRDPCR